MLRRRGFPAPTAPTYSWCLVAPRGDRSLEHVGVGGAGRTPGRSGKRDDLRVAPGRPLKTTRAAHDRKGPEPIGWVDPVAPHRQEEQVAVGRCERPGALRYSCGHSDGYVPGHRETPEMRCLALPLDMAVGDLRH